MIDERRFSRLEWEASDDDDSPECVDKALVNELISAFKSERAESARLRSELAAERETVRANQHAADREYKRRLDVTTAGFPVRLRCGAGQRLRLRLLCKRETDVEGRKSRMEAVAAALVRAGQLVEVPIVLQALADQVAEADFTRYEKRAYEVAAEAAERAAPAPRVHTFGDIAQQWTKSESAIIKAIIAWRDPDAAETLAELARREAAK